MAQVAGSIITRWSKLQYAVAFETWEASTSHHKSTQRKLKKGLYRWWFKSLATALQSWIAYTCHNVVLKVTSRRIMGRWRCGRESDFFHLWLQQSETSRNHNEAQFVNLELTGVSYQMVLFGQNDATMDPEDFRKSVHADIVQAVAHMFPNNEQAAAQVSVTKPNLTNFAVEIQYLQPQEVGRPSAVQVAKEVSEQVDNAFSRLRLRGKCTSSVAEHVQVCKLYATMPRHQCHLLSTVLVAWGAIVDTFALTNLAVANERAKERSGGDEKVNKEIVRHQEIAETEASRRMEMCKKTVDRMFHIQLAMAFDALGESIQRMKERRANAKRLIYRMLHTQVAAAFDCFCEAIDQLVAHRESVQRTISRWKKPMVQVCFDRWLDFVDISREQKHVEALDLAKEKFADQAEVRFLEREYMCCACVRKSTNATERGLGVCSKLDE